MPVSYLKTGDISLLSCGTSKRGTSRRSFCGGGDGAGRKLRTLGRGNIERRSLIFTSDTARRKGVRTNLNLSGRAVPSADIEQLDSRLCGSTCRTSWKTSKTKQDSRDKTLSGCCFVKRQLSIARIRHRETRRREWSADTRHTCAKHVCFIYTLM